MPDKHIKQISVHDLKTKLDNAEDFILVDVREVDEFNTAKIQGSTLIPLSEFAQKAPTALQKESQIVIHCHHGGRSNKACQYLASLGYHDLSNVVGGIDAWSLEIDGTVPRY